MDLNVGLITGGLVVGFIVGLTGMGGGALMTPMLVLFFNVDPLTAVSSDLVTSAVMKPVGSAVHIREGTVSWPLVRWLMLGSVPSAFSGVFVLRWLGGDDPSTLQDAVKKSLGVALLLAASALIVRAYIGMAARARRRAGVPSRHGGVRPGPIVVRPVPTVVLGVVGGLVVGMTSVGSGSLIIIALMALYPALSGAGLVGTDLVQAVPLVASAAVGHLLYGDFKIQIASSLLIGAIPGVFAGAKMSSRAPSGLIRRALALVLLASALKLLAVPTQITAFILLGIAIIGPPLWAFARRRHGLERRTIVQDLLPWFAPEAPAGVGARGLRPGVPDVPGS